MNTLPFPRRISLKYRMIEEGNSWRQNVYETQIIHHTYRSEPVILSLFIAWQTTEATPEVIPTVIADSTIIAEGRVEPVRDAEIAFITSGLVSEVLVEEGQPVKKGELLIRVWVVNRIATMRPLSSKW